MNCDPAALCILYFFLLLAAANVFMMTAMHFCNALTLRDYKFFRFYNFFDLQGGVIVGNFERIIMILALVLNQPEFIAWWLLFKLGTKWQARQFIVPPPPDSRYENMNLLDIERHASLQSVADQQATRSLVGILGNILCAALVTFFLNAWCPDITSHIRSTFLQNTTADEKFIQGNYNSPQLQEHEANH